MMVSFCVSFFPRGVLDEIFNLIESVSEGFPSYSNVLHCYNDLWKTAPERANDHYQGIDASDNRKTTRIRVGAGNGDSGVAAGKAIADAFGDRFFTPLDFELLESHMPFYQTALGDRLEYELLSTTTTV